METQKTIEKSFTVSGKGLHTGIFVTVTVRPAPPQTGIRFKRVDGDQGDEVRLGLDAVTMSGDLQGRQTAIACGSKTIVTIEHLLAALHACGIDNALVEIDGDELPALDGSAQAYVDAIEKSGVTDQGIAREVIEVTEPIELEMCGTSTVVLPYHEFKISYTLSYKHPSLADQFVSFSINEETFRTELAPARTFCLKEEAEALLAQGYGQGANYENTLVFDNNEPIENTLRFADEAARHKVVDLIGDLYVLGCPIKGHIITSKTGHSQNLELVKRLYAMKTEKNDRKAQLQKIRESKELDINQLMCVLPHRYPFLLVDRVLEIIPGKRIVALKNVTINEPFFQGHFEGHPIMPGVLIVEAMAQAGGVVTMMKEEHPEDKVAYFMSIDKVKFRAPVIPGDQLRMEVEVIRSKGPIGVCACKSFVKDKLVCEGEVKFTIMDR